MRRLLLSAALLVGAMALLAGCGGDSEQLQHSATDWAAGYCSNATTWVTSLDEARASVKTGHDAGRCGADRHRRDQHVHPGGRRARRAGHAGRQHVGGDSEEPRDDALGPGGAHQRRDRHEQPQRHRRAADGDRGHQIAASLADVTTTNATLAEDDAELGTAMNPRPTAPPRRRARQGPALTS